MRAPRFALSLFTDGAAAPTEFSFIMQMFHFAPRPLALGAALLCLSLGAHSEAQAQEQVAASAPEKLDKVVVTGNPLRSQDLTQASNVLSGDALTLTRGASLGETLQGLPGVAATNFGPNSSRPTIRGLDGDRVRMLSNSGASVDASSLSFDHAVPVDPLVVDRIEVLRGAAALLYGGNAIGGVVNTLDNRIPRGPQAGLSGAAEVRLGGRGEGAQRCGGAGRRQQSVRLACRPGRTQRLGHRGAAFLQ